MTFEQWLALLTASLTGYAHFYLLSIRYRGVEYTKIGQTSDSSITGRHWQITNANGNSIPYRIAAVFMNMIPKFDVRRCSQIAQSIAKAEGVLRALLLSKGYAQPSCVYVDGNPSTEVFRASVQQVLHVLNEALSIMTLIGDGAFVFKKTRVQKVWTILLPSDGPQGHGGGDGDRCSEDVQAQGERKWSLNRRSVELVETYWEDFKKSYIATVSSVHASSTTSLHRKFHAYILSKTTEQQRKKIPGYQSIGSALADRLQKNEPKMVIVRVNIKKLFVDDLEGSSTKFPCYCIEKAEWQTEVPCCYKLVNLEDPALPQVKEESTDEESEDRDHTQEAFLAQAVEADAAEAMIGSPAHDSDSQDDTPLPLLKKQSITQDLSPVYECGPVCKKANSSIKVAVELPRGDNLLNNLFSRSDSAQTLAYASSGGSSQETPQRRTRYRSKTTRAESPSSSWDSQELDTACNEFEQTTKIAAPATRRTANGVDLKILGDPALKPFKKPRAA